jgi:hypothetical protein
LSRFPGAIPALSLQKASLSRLSVECAEEIFYYLHRKSPKVGVPYHLVGRNKILVGEEPSYFEPNFFFYQARCRKHGINERSEKGEENKHKQKSHKRGEPNETNHEPMKRSEEIELRK